MEHVSIFPASYLPSHLDEHRFTVDDLNFLILVKILYTVDCGENKTINLLIKNSTLSLECFLEDYKANNKKFNEWTNAAETLRIGIFSKSENRLSLLHAQVNGRCSDSSHSRLKRHCSTKWIEDHDAVFVFKEFYPAVVGYLHQLSELRDGEGLERAMPYLKAVTTAGFLVSLEVINATLKLTMTVAKKLQGIKKLF